MYRIPPETNAIESRGQTVRVLLSGGDVSCRIAVFDGVLSAAECARLIELAQPKLARSTVCGDGAADVVDPIRTSDHTFLARAVDPLLAIIDERISDLVHFAVPYGEALQVLRYRPGQEYRVHSDAFPATDAARIGTSGNRVGTFLIYLTDPPTGGATILPRLELAVHPHAGMGFWFEYPAGAPWIHDADHVGSPPLTGEKWAATKWFRERTFA